MTQHEKLLPFITDLIDHGKDLWYRDHYENQVHIRIQPLLVIDKINKDPNNLRKLRECGAVGALVIGNDEFGVPVIVSSETLKTYLLEGDDDSPEALTKNEIVIRHGPG